MKNEQELIKKLISTKFKDEAFKELLDCYQEQLYWYIRKIVLTHENANDVLQNTFIRVYKSIANFKQRSSLSTWMHRIAYNESIRLLDKQLKIYSSSINEIQEYNLNTLTSDPYFDENSTEKKLQQLILGFPKLQRNIFNMKYFDDLKFREIAQILEIKEGTIKSSYYKSVKYIEENINVLELSNKNKV